jgi:hypothetical protein
VIRYLITRHVGLTGVRLSKPGHWGNLPYPDDVAAESAARADAARVPFTVDRRTYGRPKEIACA